MIYQVMTEMSTPKSPLPGRVIHGRIKLNQLGLKSRTSQAIFIQLVTCETDWWLLQGTETFFFSFSHSKNEILRAFSFSFLGKTFGWVFCKLFCPCGSSKGGLG